MAKEIKKVVQLDVSAAEKNIDGLNKKVDELKKNIGELNTTTADLSKTTSKNTEASKEAEQETEKQITTVKDLKKEINSLRDSLVPMTKGSEEWNKTTTDLVEKQKQLTNVMQASKEQMTAAEGSYNALQNEMSSLRREWKETTDETTRANLGQRIAEINAQLKEYDATIGSFQRNVGDYRGAIADVAKEYTSQRAELKALRVELETLDPSTQEYIDKFNRAAEITHNMAEQQEMLKYSSKDLGDQLSNMRGIASNLAAGYSAVNAAMGLFGGESEDVRKAMLKVQQAMAIVQGLQGLDGFIKRTKGLSTAMKVWRAESKKTTVQQTAQATATKAAAAAMVSEETATVAATTAQKGLNLALNANPIGIIITALAVLLPILEKTFGIVTKVTKAIEKFFNKEKAEAKEAKKAAEEYIADREAQQGADWKFTEEGQKYYQQYFDSLLKMYKKDSKDFKEAQREKWEYERELRENQEKAAEDAKKKDEERRKDAVDAAKKAAEKIKQIESDYQSKVAQTVGASYKDAYKKFRETVTSFVDYFNKAGKDLKDNPLTKWIKDFNKEYTKALDDIMTDNELFIRETQAMLNGLSQEEINMFVGFEGGTIDKEEFKNAVESIGQEGGMALADAVKIRMSVEATRLNKQAVALLKDIINNSSEEANKSLNDEIIKLFEKTISPTVNEEVSKLQAELNSKTIQLDFEIETGMALEPFSEGDYLYVDQMASEFEKAKTIYDKNVEMLEKQKAYYQEIVDFVKNNNLLPSDEYKNAEAQIESLNAALLQAKSTYYTQQGQIRQKYFDKELKDIQNQTNSELAMAQMNYEKQIGFMEVFAGVMPQKEAELQNQMYEIRKEGLQRQLDAYQQQLFEQNLTADERIETERMVATLMAQIEEEEIRHTIETNQQRVESFQYWYSAAQDAVGGIADLVGGLADYYEADVEAQVKAGKMTEEQADAEFENIKKMRIAEALINTIAGSIGAYLQASATYAPPFGQIIGAISAAAVAAAGAAQIAKIKSSTRNGSSTSNTAIASPNIQPYEPQYVTNVTGASEVDNLRNAMYEQPIYVRVTDIDDAQQRRRTRVTESEF